MYLGDFANDSVVNVLFSTHALSGAPAAPSSAFEAADIVIYRDDSATQKTTANGLTMTSPFDSLTGLHQLKIDTSIDTGDSGFWAPLHDYKVVLNPDETVDGIAVLAVLAEFSIENRNRLVLDSARRTIFVATTGSDSNNGLTPATAKLTLEGAEAVAASGDRVFLYNGTYSGAVGWGVNGTTIEGQSRTGVVITHNGTSTMSITGTTGVTLKNMTITASAETGGSGIGLIASNTASARIESCDINGHFDAAQFNGSTGLYVVDCAITGTYDALNATSVIGVFERNKFTTTATSANTSASKSAFRVTAAAALPCMTLRDNDFVVIHVTSNTGDLIACTVMGTMIFEGSNRFRTINLDAGYTGDMIGIKVGDPSTGAYCRINGPAFDASTVGSNDIYHIKTEYADSVVDIASNNFSSLALTGPGVVNNIAPAVGSPMTLADDAITAAKFDESTAFPIKSADASSTAIARTGADGDTLKSLSDEVSAISTGSNPNVILESEIASVTNQTTIVLNDGATFNDAYNGQTIVLYDNSNSDYPSVRIVSDYVGSTKTVTLDSAPDFTVAADDSVRLFATAPGTAAPTAATVAAAVRADQAIELARIDAAISTRNATAPPTVGAIADAVLDEVLSGHTTAGTLGKALGDTAGTVATNLDAKVSESGGAVDFQPVLEAIAEVATDVLNGVAAVGFYANQPPASAELTEEQIQDIVDGLVEAGAVATPVSADVVDDSRTWFADDAKARNIVTVNQGFSGTLALKPDLNPGAGVLSVTSVTITGAATVTATGLEVNRARDRAHFNVPALNTVGTYTVKVTVLTIDSQSFTTTATLRVQ